MLKRRIIIRGCWIVIVVMALLLANNHLEVFPVNVMPANCSKGDIRILSYNLNSRSEMINRHISDIGDLVLGIRPDFVFFTEYEGAADDALKERLESVYPFVYDEHRQLPYQSDIMFSKWSIDSVRTYPLKGHYYSLYRVQIHERADTIAVYCCHLSSNNLERNKGRLESYRVGCRLRLLESKAIADALKVEQYPAVVIGDFNDVNSSEAIQQLKESGLNEAWWSGGLGYGSTYSDGLLYLRIDHVLYNNNNMKLRRIDTVGDFNYSDHKALIADFSFMRKNE